MHLLNPLGQTEESALSRLAGLHQANPDIFKGLEVLLVLQNSGLQMAQLPLQSRAALMHSGRQILDLMLQALKRLYGDLLRRGPKDRPMSNWEIQLPMRQLRFHGPLLNQGSHGPRQQ